jgi:hypothetical protein
VTRTLSACGHPLCFETCDEDEDLVLALDDAAARALMGENGRKWALRMGLTEAEGPLLEVIAYSPSQPHREQAAHLLIGALWARAEAA